MPTIHPDHLEAYALMQGQACRVLHKHARQQFPETRTLRRLDKRLHRHAARPAPTRLTSYIHRKFRDTGVALARPVYEGSSEGYYLSIILDNHNRVRAVEPGSYLRLRARASLEGGNPILDALIVYAGDSGSVGSLSLLGSLVEAP